MTIPCVSRHVYRRRRAFIMQYFTFAIGIPYEFQTSSQVKS